MSFSTKIRTQKIFKTIIISFYLVIMLAVAGVIIGIVFPYFELPLYANILFGMIFTILGVLGGSYLSLISDLDSEVYRKFDNVKNLIADNQVNSPIEFSKLMSDFLIKTFNYTSFDIQHTIFKISDSRYYFSNEILYESMKDELAEFNTYSKKEASIKYIKTILLERHKIHSYGIPIWFRKEYLGYFIVFSKQKLKPFFQQYLCDFEDLYIDDQLKIVLDKQLIIEQKHMYQEIDVYSNKITKNKYYSIGEYCNDVLKYFIDKLDCFGGLIKLHSATNIVSIFKTDKEHANEITDYYGNKSIPSKQKYYQIPNFGNPIMMQIPIGIELPYGVIYLFSETDSKFNYYNSIIDGVEDIKLDNDFENLTKFHGSFSGMPTMDYGSLPSPYSDR